jgi:transcriptional regulator with XRE-family HTH domain
MKRYLTLKQYRELLKYKQVDVAESVQLSQSSYSQIENGLSSTSLENYDKIAKFYGIDIDYVMSNEIPVFIYVFNKGKTLSDSQIKREIEDVLSEISEKIKLIKLKNKF